MNAQDFAVMKEMQHLCTSLEQDVKKLSEFNESLQAIHQRYENLSTLYQQHWQRIIESDELDLTQKKVIESIVAEGSYSVFGQDTVWNVLSDLHVEYIQLLKLLASQI